MVKPGLKTIQLYSTLDGKRPFSQWLAGLKDIGTVARIRARIDRVEEGNLGNCKNLGNGIYELKFDFGAGYRVYFAMDGDYIILLLIGGDKSTQQRDINKARNYWTDYLMRKKK